MSSNYSINTEFQRISQMISNLTYLFPRMIMSESLITKIDNDKSQDPTLNSLAKELYKKLQLVKMPEDYEQMAQAYEDYSECDFYIRMKDKGIKLNRTQGTGGNGQKRPDFEYDINNNKLFFELKTLEVMNPLMRNKAIANQALENAAELDSRAKSPGVHISLPLEISGYDGELTSAQRIDETIKKISQNIKEGQINHGHTILVVNLGRLPNVTFGASSLLPAFYHEPSPSSVVSGELWQIAYGKIGEQIFGIPEFDGASNLDGHQEKEGIIHQFSKLVAITFMKPILSGETELFTIWNNALPELTDNFQQDIEETIYKYSDALNNTNNEKGWKHTVYK